MDRLNASSYAYHYRNLDSAQALAQRAYDLSDGYPDGRAEALNNLAFTSMARMDYAAAQQQLDEADRVADNFVELYVAAVQQMRLCQRRSANRDFYEYRERADRSLRRIRESHGELTPRQQRRMAYAESEYAIVSSAYFYYVGLRPQSVAAIEPLAGDVELQHDTAQYLNYLYNVGAGGIIEAPTAEETAQREVEMLAQCYFLARQSGCTFFVAQAMEALSEHLQDSAACARLLADNYLTIKSICTGQDSPRLMAGWLADVARGLFASYGDVYQTAGAERTLASCYMAVGEYATAVAILERSLSTERVQQAPDLVASIREQLSVAYAAVGNKAASDLNRNVYLDLQEGTRQDRQLEARAETLERTSRQLSVLILLVVVSIGALVFLLWLFSHLSHKSQGGQSLERLLQPLQAWKERQETLARESAARMDDLTERRDLALARKAEGARLSVENQAKVALVGSITPLIDRMLHEMHQLEGRTEDEATRRDRLDYVAALAAQIDRHNAVLTQWIQLRGGQLRLRIESFALQPLLDIVAKSRAAFKAKGVELVVRPTDAVVKADRVLTLFMVNTLADNARKFTPEGGRVEIAVDAAADGCVELSVSDTGCGIAPEKLEGLFDRKVHDGHGFGLMNCRGIIDQYRKVSALFACCTLAAESRVGEGSRFFFRLPRGVVRLLAGLLLALTPCLAQEAAAQTDGARADSLAVAHSPELQRASAYADSAYYSNIAATYRRTLSFADSCLLWLNRHARRVSRGKASLMQTEPGGEPAELAWWRDSMATAYDVILDVRNETAVAALALRRWDIYETNNQAYTRLYKEMSQDRSLPEYCRTMQRSQANKTVAVVLSVLALLMVLPAYYLLYYRHILHYRLCVDRVNALNALLQGPQPSDEKLRLAGPLAVGDFPPQLREVVDSVMEALRKAAADESRQALTLSEAADALARAEYEAARLHVANAVLDNALSALKHETMYYPSRIAQLAREGEPKLAELRETLDYYHDVFLALSLQAAHPLQGLTLAVRPVAASRYADLCPEGLDVAGDEAQLDLLFHTLRSLCLPDGCRVEAAADESAPYVRLTLTAQGFKDARLQAQADPFAPSEASIPLLVCRQVVRSHSEATGRRGCGMDIRKSPGYVEISVTLPRCTLS